MLRSTYLVNKIIVWKLEINWTMAPEIWHAYSSISCPCRLSDCFRFLIIYY